MERKRSLEETVRKWYRKIIHFFVGVSLGLGMILFSMAMPTFAQENSNGNSNGNLQESSQENSYQTVRVGYYQKRDFQEGDGETSLRRGYSYEYLQKISAYTGWKYEYVPGSWEELYEKLVDGQIDVLAGVAYSKERENQIDYPDYEMLKETFYIYKDVADSSMKSGDIASYAGKRIGVVADQKVMEIVNAWIEEHQAGIEVVTYKDLASCASDFNEHRIDGFVSADNIVSNYTGITPVELLGREPYYLAVSKKNPELLEELNIALSIISSQDSLYLDSLRKKYTADTSISVFLSQQEQEWMKRHPQITVGYLNNYMPYSDTKKDGSVTGLVADLIPDLFNALPGDYHPEIVYHRFDTHEEMIEGLKNGSVDFVFPVGGEIQYAEKLGYQQSTVVVSSSTDLVYKGDYSEQTTRRMAVNRDNQLQYFYTVASYPQAEIIYCDTIEDCMKMVKTGMADSTIINALRSVKLVGTDESLNILPLEKPDDRCFGVNFGNGDLLRILNHGIAILGDGYGINHAYQYIGELVAYTADDFFRAHTEVVYIAVSVMLILIILLGVERYKNLHRRAEKEREQNQVLEDALRRAQQASYAKQVFLNNMSHDIRTPLNAILGIIEINQKTKDEALIEANRKKAIASIYQLLSLVNNVIEMSKLEGEASTTEQEHVNLKKVTDGLEKTIAKQASNAGLELVRESTELADCEIYGNSVHIHEVLQHILENAVKYNRPHGRIVWKESLRSETAGSPESESDGSAGFKWAKSKTGIKNAGDITEKTGQTEEKVVYECTVSDTGIGMEPEFLKRIFEPFSQERMDARTVYRGAGLGMPIAKTLIDQMNGTIEVKSVREVGTTVHIVIPFTKVPEEKQERQEERLNERQEERQREKQEERQRERQRERQKEQGQEEAHEAREAYEGQEKQKNVPECSGVEENKAGFEENEVDFDEKSDQAQQNTQALQDLSGMKILLVEDNELNIEIARFLLEDAGASVFVATDGAQAVLSYLNEIAGTFDAILMDIMMPVMDGYEATRQIRSSGKKDATTIPILATTACVSDEARTECTRAGMNEFLEKPLDMNKVIATIVRVTDQNRIA